MQAKAVKEKRITKTALATKLGISRGMLYYQHKQPLIDEEVKQSDRSGVDRTQDIWA